MMMPKHLPIATPPSAIQHPKNSNFVSGVARTYLKATFVVPDIAPRAFHKFPGSQAIVQKV